MINIKITSEKEPFKTKASTRGFLIDLDEPIDKGGLDTAMTPSELLGASLGACTSITLRMYMSHKEWPHGSVDVDVSFEMDTKGTTFHRLVKIEGDFDDKQKTRLMSVANACPIHKLLEKGHTIETELILEHSD